MGSEECALGSRDGSAFSSLLVCLGFEGWGSPAGFGTVTALGKHRRACGGPGSPCQPPVFEVQGWGEGVLSGCSRVFVGLGQASVLELFGIMG